MSNKFLQILLFFGFLSKQNQTSLRINCFVFRVSFNARQSKLSRIFGEKNEVYSCSFVSCLCGRLIVSYFAYR